MFVGWNKILNIVEILRLILDLNNIHMKYFVIIWPKLWKSRKVVVELKCLRLNKSSQVLINGQIAMP